MSWQDRERERYEGMLAERWDAKGFRIHRAMGQTVVCSGAPITVTLPRAQTATTGKGISLDEHWLEWGPMIARATSDDTTFNAKTVTTVKEQD